jgi:hypothetical protein
MQRVTALLLSLCALSVAARAEPAKKSAGAKTPRSGAKPAAKVAPPAPKAGATKATQASATATAPATATATAPENATSLAPKAGAQPTPQAQATSLDTLDSGDTPQEFRAKLTEMLARTEKSIKLLREQITESQSAPFLPELYLQLAELLTQRSNTLYYVQMEKLKGAPVPDAKDKLMSPVVQAQQEAIALYEMLLKDFADHPKRGQIVYRMALALKSIDEIPRFMATAARLLREYPNSEEATKTRLLLGQYYFEKADYPEASAYLKPVAASSSVYERNLAKYRLGIIAITNEKYADALKQFEEVVADPDLKEQDNPYSVSLKSRQVKSDLKREALIDSIRAYTFVYAKDPDPIGYYSKLAPTEVHYQETIEKLALRYIFLKKYDQAVKLLRTLSERTADPQKIINIYQEVLLMIPVKDRVNLPLEEIRFVLDKYNVWSNSFDLPGNVRQLSWNFFEKQVRDLATTAHDLAKVEKDTRRKTELLERAQEFYLMYLGFFGRTPSSQKMGNNLGDVYYLKGDYLRSGEYYLRSFRGEFGPVPQNQRKPLIENAILALQKKADYSFYENLRKRGLLIASVKAFMAFEPAKKNDPGLQLIALKAEYEQGFFPESLENLFGLMKKFPKTTQAVDAGNLILDYFNTRSDFSGLSYWSDRMRDLKLPNAAFNAKLAQVGKQAKSRVLQEKVKETQGYDEFSEGKSYLTAALSSGDAAFSNAALQQALARAKAERDFGTFFMAATAMAEKERDETKRTQIIRSISREYSKLTRYYEAIESSRKVQSNTQFPTRVRADALDEEVNTLLLLRDMRTLQASVSSPFFASIAPETKQRLKGLLADTLESPAGLSQDLVAVLISLGLTEESLLSLYKSQYRVPSATRAKVLQEARSRCSSDSRQALCRWNQASALEVRRTQVLQALARGGGLEAIEKLGQAVMTLIGAYSSLEGSGDAHLETVIALRTHHLYLSFGNFLNKLSQANPDLRPVLVQKAKESYASANMYLSRCKLIAQRSTQVNPATRHCARGTTAELRGLMEWSDVAIASPPRKDPQGGNFDGLQATIFAGKGKPDTLLSLVQEYYQNGYHFHAAAGAAYGATTDQAQAPSYKAVWGCALTELGLLSEASFHLKSADSEGGMKERCLAKIQRVRGVQ